MLSFRLLHQFAKSSLSKPQLHFTLTNSSSYSSYATVNNVKLHYEKSGTGSHNIICLPGVLGTGLSDFKPQLKGSLDQNKFTIVAWDPPGYGKSRPPDRSYEGDFFHRDADSVASLMETLQLTPFSVLGWSDGGVTGIILAQKRPDLVKKLVVWGANAFIIQDDLDKYYKVGDISQWSPSMRAPMEAIYGNELFQKTWTSWLHAVERMHAAGGDVCTKELTGVKCPTLVIHGVKDALVGVDHAVYINENIKNARLHKMDEGKHNLHLRYSDKFAELVQSFLLNNNL